MKKKLNYQGVSTLEVLEWAKNYNQWIADCFLPEIRSPLLEIGSGIGNISNYFLDFPKVTFSENDRSLVRNLKKKFHGRLNVNVVQLDVLQSAVFFRKNKFATIICINVLEHIDDDQGALQNIFNGLEHGGKLLLLVPAKKFAYSRLDKNLGHFRRYEKDELSQKLLSSGFVITKIRYFNFVGLLSWMIRDRIERNHLQLSPKHVALFEAVVPLLKKVESVIPVPLGVSLLCFAQKE